MRTDDVPSAQPGICQKCNAPLPLRDAQYGQEEARWVCAACGARYRGELDHTLSAEIRQNVLLAPLRLDCSRLAPPPKLTATFIAERLNHDYHGHERRVHKRRPIAAPVAVQPLDDHFFPAGEPFVGTAHNISGGGIALIHTRSTTAPYLALELALEDATVIRVVIQVVRCRAVGLFYEIAGLFLVRIAPK